MKQLVRRTTANALGGATIGTALIVRVYAQEVQLRKKGRVVDGIGPFSDWMAMGAFCAGIGAVVGASVGFVTSLLGFEKRLQRGRS